MSTTTIVIPSESMITWRYNLGLVAQGLWLPQQRASASQNSRGSEMPKPNALWVYIGKMRTSTNRSPVCRYIDYAPLADSGNNLNGLTAHIERNWEVGERQCPLDHRLSFAWLTADVLDVAAYGMASVPELQRDLHRIVAACQEFIMRNPPPRD